MVAVEFQPSPWSRGTFLNVGCIWLWNVNSHISFDEGSRQEPFIAFESEHQFRNAAEKLAQQAAERTVDYRRRFPTIQSVSDYYTRHTPNVGWPAFNAAIAHGLSGRVEIGRRLLQSCLGERSPENEWEKKLQSDARALATIMDDQKRFHRLISDRVRQTRELHKLPARAEVDFAK